MGLFNFLKRNEKSSDEKRVEDLTAKANRGDAEAMFYLGNFYDESGNYTKAEKWWLAATVMGHSTAKYFLALNYSLNPTKKGEAVRYLEELVDEGYHEYAGRLGSIYCDYQNKIRSSWKQFYDLKKAEKYFLLAMHSKSKSCWINGNLYELGVIYAGKEVFPYIDDDVKCPLKAAYCFYLSSLIEDFSVNEGSQGQEEFEKVISTFSLNITDEQLAKWRKDYNNMDFTM